MRTPRPLVLLIAGALLTSCARGGDPTPAAAAHHAGGRSPTPSARATHRSASPTRRPLVPLYLFHVDQHPAIRDALAFIRGRVNVPVVLPPKLPMGLRLARGHPVYRFSERPPGFFLVLAWAGHGEFSFQFGAAAFDGCGAESAHPIEIRGHPALIQIYPHDQGAEVIWPATPSHPTGKYGVGGLLPSREIIALAESMPVLTGRGDQGNC